MPRNKEQAEQIRSESRAKIVATARRLFAERGFDRCSVSDIAREAGMSQGNIYWYFPSKEALLRAVLAEVFEALEALFAEALAMPGSGRERLIALIDRYLQLGRGGGGAEASAIINTLIAQGASTRLTDLGFDAEQIVGGYHQALGSLIAQAQAEGALAPGNDPALLTMFYFAFFNGLPMTYREQADAIPGEVLREAMLRLLGG